MNIRLLHPSEIDAVWPLVSAGFGRALAKGGGDMSLGSLYQQCVSGSARVLVAHDTEILGAAAFRHEVWTTGQKLRCLAMYGRRFREWKDEGVKAMHALKDAFGAGSIIFEGRLGQQFHFPNAKVLRALYEVA